MLQRRLRRDVDAADVDVDHAIHLFERRLGERFRKCGAGIVHQHIEPAEGREGFVDRGLDGFRVGGVCLDRDCLASLALDRLNDGRGGVGSLGVGDGHIRSIGGQTFGDRGPDAARTAGYEDCFIA